MIRKLPLVLSVALFLISAYRKVRDMMSSEGHFMMGPGRPYPAFMLYVAFAQELSLLVLLFVDRPLGTLLMSGFIGGILHANTHPISPVGKGGAKGAVPVVLVALSAVWLALQGTNGAGPFSRRLGLTRLRPAGMLLVALVAMAGGGTFGMVLTTLHARGEGLG